MANAPGQPLKTESFKQGLLLAFVGIGVVLVLLQWRDALLDRQASQPVYVRSGLPTAIPALQTTPSSGAVSAPEHGAGGGRRGHEPTQTALPGGVGNPAIPTPTDEPMPLMDQ